jgi:hypothetical protein
VYNLKVNDVVKSAVASQIKDRKEHTSRRIRRSLATLLTRPQKDNDLPRLLFHISNSSDFNVSKDKHEEDINPDTSSNVDYASTLNVKGSANQ